MATASFQEDRARDALDAQLLATDLADYLVRRGVPFRESHEVVGRLVRRSEEEGTPLSELPLTTFRDEHAAFAEDVLEVFDWERSLDARDGVGGTSRRAVLEQLAQARARLEDADGA